MIRLGIVGLDTSHAGEFTKRFNHVGVEEEQWVDGAKVVAACAGESKIKSMEEIEAEAKIMAERFGVELVNRPEDMLGKIDAVLIESQEGSSHFTYAKPFIMQGMPKLVDKPFACSLAEAKAMSRLAVKKKAPLFSSSSLRYALEIQKL
ncbi:MAG: Gfo/Idh/MocA family oxidoreductase, partial [Thermoproteota archaeon]